MTSKEKARRALMEYVCTACFNEPDGECGCGVSNQLLDAFEAAVFVEAPVYADFRMRLLVSLLSGAAHTSAGQGAPQIAKRALEIANEVMKLLQEVP